MEMVLGIFAGLFVLIGLPLLRHFANESKRKELQTKVFVNLEKEIIEIIQGCKETVAYGPVFEGFDTLLRIPIIAIDEQKQRIESSRVRSLIMLIEKVGWNCEYPKLSMGEVSDLVEFATLTKANAISCTLVRISRTNFLNDVYEKCFKERLNNPMLYLLKKGDDHLYSVYEKFRNNEIIVDIDCNVSLSKDTYLRYFSNELDATVSRAKEKSSPIHEDREITKESMLIDLDIIEKEYNNSSFYILEKMLSSEIKENPDRIISQVRKNEQSFKEYLYNVVGNVTGDWLESGKYHVYRGVLNSVGQDMLKMFDRSNDLLLLIKAKNVTEGSVKKQKEIIRSNIKQIG